MKPKRIAMLLALLLFMSAFLTPLTAFAEESGDPVFPPVTEPDDGPAEEAPAEDDPVAAIPDGALTPDGTGTILDHVTEADDKQFYTITTEDGSIFYLIIDGKREENNVYFLNTVTLADLAALAEKKKDGSISAIPSAEDCICSDKCEAGRIDVECEVCKRDLTACAGTEVQTSEPAGEPSQSGGNIGMIVLIAIAVLAFTGAGVYVKIIRPKKQAKDADDEFDDEDYGEDFDPDREYGTGEELPEDDAAFSGETGDAEEAEES